MGREGFGGDDDSIVYLPLEGLKKKKPQPFYSSALALCIWVAYCLVGVTPG